MFIDTHAHLNIMSEKNDTNALLTHEQMAIVHLLINEANNANVNKIINVGTNINESIASVQIAKQYKSVFATIGIHPSDAQNDTSLSLLSAATELKKLLVRKQENKIVAIGEIGMDFHHTPFNKTRQEDFFRMQLEIALAYSLPVSIHLRDAAQELLKVLEEYIKNGIHGVIHCFSQPQDIATIILDWGFFVGLDAPITYPKNDSMRDVFKNIPLNRIILETDSPFLPPQKLRGKQNKPAYIPIIAQALADLKEVDIDLIAQTTSHNATRLFGLQDL